MPPINIDSVSSSRQVDPDPAQNFRRTPARVPHPAIEPATGKVYALKDGSGYVALASDGHYYRIDTGHGLAFSRGGAFVDAAMVDVMGGPVSAVKIDPDRADPGDADPIGPGATQNTPDERAELQLPGSRRRADRKGSADEPALLKNTGQAKASSRAAHALIIQQPEAALDSQARLSVQMAVSLLS